MASSSPGWINPLSLRLPPAAATGRSCANLLRWTGTAGNLTSDAHVAALAIEHGAAVCSADHDFKRFPGVEHINPLEDGGRLRD